MTKAPIHAEPLAAALARKVANGLRGSISDNVIASGDGWWAQDIICTCGPRDHEAEELTMTSSLALVLSGSFVVRDQVPNAAIPVNPLGLTVTYVRVDEAFK